MYGLYRWNGKCEEKVECEAVYEFCPSPKEPLFWLKHKNGPYDRKKLILVEIGWALLSLGNYKLYYTKDAENIVTHTSFCIYRCFKFPFLKDSKNIQIGPCFTKESVRGKGIYPMVVHYICKREKTSGSDIYMIIRDENTASIKGAEKAGFEKISNLKKSRFLKIYSLEK